MKTLANIAIIAIATMSIAACGAVDDTDLEDDDIVDIDEDIDEELDEEIDEEELPLAAFDNDSLQNPAESYFLSPTNTRDFTFTNDISSEAGDAQDFVEFEFPNNSNSSQIVRMTLDCALVGDADAIARVRIFEDGESTNKTVFCNDGEETLTVDNTKVQTAVIEFSSVAVPTYLDYTLTVVGYR